MSASEKLRSLQWITPQLLVTNRSGVFIDLDDWRRIQVALPLVADIAEAAEQVVAYTAGGWQEGIENPRISRFSIPLRDLEEQL